LASEHVGCVEESIEDGEIIVVDDCQERVYGAFRPAALISNIAVISGLLGATLMPLAGAVWITQRIAGMSVCSQPWRSLSFRLVKLG